MATKKLDLRNIVTSKALIEMNRILADPSFIHCFLGEVCEDFLFICFLNRGLPVFEGHIKPIGTHV